MSIVHQYWVTDSLSASGEPAKIWPYDKVEFSMTFVSLRAVPILYGITKR